jgi:hypothetical protein
MQWFEGVLGSDSTMSPLSETSTSTTTPSEGEHFQYAKITRADELRLCSAPIWVIQRACGGAATAPTFSATASSGNGTIRFNANASDNVGVIRVAFVADGGLKPTDTTSPCSATLDRARWSMARRPL